MMITHHARADQAHEHACHDCGVEWVCTRPGCVSLGSDQCEPCAIRQCDEWWGVTHPETTERNLLDAGRRREL